MDDRATDVTGSTGGSLLAKVTLGRTKEAVKCQTKKPSRRTLVPYFIILALFISTTWVSLYHRRPNDRFNSQLNIVIVHKSGDDSGVVSHHEQIAQFVAQYRLFDSQSTIFIVSEQSILDHMYNNKFQNVRSIDMASLIASPHHKAFCDSNPLDTEFRGGFWSHASERFFYLNDLISSQSYLENIFFLEYDNMLYYDLRNLLDELKETYPGGALTFLNNELVIPGLMYFRDSEAVKEMVEYFSQPGHLKNNDMLSLADYAKKTGNLKALPVINMQVPECPMAAVGTEDLQVMFDAAAYGQFLTGIDPRNSGNKNTTGYVNEDSCFNVRNVSIVWEKIDDLLVPMVNGIQLVNLHVHSKDLARWRSDRVL